MNPEKYGRQERKRLEKILSMFGISAENSEVIMEYADMYAKFSIWDYRDDLQADRAVSQEGLKNG